MATCGGNANLTASTAKNRLYCSTATARPLPLRPVYATPVYGTINVYGRNTREYNVMIIGFIDLVMMNDSYH